MFILPQIRPVFHVPLRTCPAAPLPPASAPFSLDASLRDALNINLCALEELGDD